MTDTRRIEAAELAGVRRSADGTRVILDLREAAGEHVLLSLPIDCLNAVVAAAPRDVNTGRTHRLDSWSINPSENGEDLVLTLRTPDAAAISFTIKSWQIEGMATIAAYGTFHRGPASTLH